MTQMHFILRFDYHARGAKWLPNLIKIHWDDESSVALCIPHLSYGACSMRALLRGEKY